MATLTKRKAISECKKLWKEIEKSGLTKYGFLGSPAGTKWRDKQYWGSCPLCAYATQGGSYTCTCCPLKTQYGKICSDLGFDDSKHSSPKWFEAIRGLK